MATVTSNIKAGFMDTDQHGLHFGWRISSTRNTLNFSYTVNMYWRYSLNMRLCPTCTIVVIAMAASRGSISLPVPQPNGALRPISRLLSICPKWHGRTSELCGSKISKALPTLTVVTDWHIRHDAPSWGITHIKGCVIWFQKFCTVHCRYSSWNLFFFCFLILLDSLTLSRVLTPRPLLIQSSVLAYSYNWR